MAAPILWIHRIISHPAAEAKKGTASQQVKAALFFYLELILWQVPEFQVYVNFPVQRGGRFSTKARGPSFASSLRSIFMAAGC